MAQPLTSRQLRIVIVDPSSSRHGSSIHAQQVQPLLKALALSDASVETVGVPATGEHATKWGDFEGPFWTAMLAHPVDLLVILQGDEWEFSQTFRTQWFEAIAGISALGQKALLVCVDETPEGTKVLYPETIERVTWWDTTQRDPRAYAFGLLARARR